MILTRNPALVATEMDGEIVMMSVEKGAYYGLSGIGAQIWDALESPRTFDYLIGILRDQFDVDENTLRSDVHAFLLDMKSEGIVTEA
ncbi:PqqD family peptide modification chaperone [Novosphingobium beihaiensis]|uniref:PqqD family peptide modification chaperone n=1 Tax=Novosphingobium beihaiensis TaxID=2930389 RepID=A0ABT0BWK0_9SPHN|nr:PqqD family peptide modification chaperone [Novosphingobium beihaiensis]MCJ2189196.1 PqqD family peptide modification chaperone [Novosphingobium beihaiensis]